MGPDGIVGYGSKSGGLSLPIHSPEHRVELANHRRIRLETEHLELLVKLLGRRPHSELAHIALEPPVFVLVDTDRSMKGTVDAPPVPNAVPSKGDRLASDIPDDRCLPLEEQVLTFIGNQHPERRVSQVVNIPLPGDLPACPLPSRFSDPILLDELGINVLW